AVKTALEQIIFEITEGEKSDDLEHVRNIVRGILQVCNELGMTAVAEGIETYEEFAVLRDVGIELFQGYYFARPAFQSLAQVPGDVFLAPRNQYQVTHSLFGEILIGRHTHTALEHGGKCAGAVVTQKVGDT